MDLLTPAEQILNSPVLRYRVNFPLRNVIPKITQISFNGRIFCYGPSEPGTSSTPLNPTSTKKSHFTVSVDGVTNLWANVIFRINQYTYNIQSGVNNPFISNNVNNYNEPSSPNVPQVTPPISEFQNVPVTTRPPKLTVEESCGLANDIQTLVLKGDKTVDNEYPWLAAMFHRQGVSYTFQCTSNLITNRHVITGNYLLVKNVNQNESFSQLPIACGSTKPHSSPKRTSSWSWAAPTSPIGLPQAP